MDSVEEIEAAIDRLSPEDFLRVVEWLKAHEQSRQDEQIDRDSASGKLDFLFHEAESETSGGFVREWPVLIQSRRSLLGKRTTNPSGG